MNNIPTVQPISLGSTKPAVFHSQDVVNTFIRDGKKTSEARYHKYLKRKAKG